MKKLVLVALIALCGSAFAAQPAPSKAPAKAATKPAPPPKEIEREIPYADLGRFLGKPIIVHSILGTVRRGTLSHYTQSQIDITLDNGAQLSFDRDSIKSASVPVTAEESTSSDSAKKN